MAQLFDAVEHLPSRYVTYAPAPEGSAISPFFAAAASPEPTVDRGQHLPMLRTQPRRGEEFAQDARFGSIHDTPLPGGIPLVLPIAEHYSVNINNGAALRPLS